MARRNRFLLMMCALGALAGCGTPGAPAPPSLELPRAVEDLTATRKGNAVTLSWTPASRTTEGRNVRLKKLGPTVICRAINEFPMFKCAQNAGQVAPVPPRETAGEEKTPPPKAEFTDHLPPELQQSFPSGFAAYAVEARNWRGRSAGLSNQVKVPLAPVLPPPLQVGAEVTAEGVVLTFRCPDAAPPSSALRYGCRVYRQQKGAKTSAVTADVPHGDPSCEAEGGMCLVTDHSFTWEESYAYWVCPVTEVLQNGQKVAEVQGENSPSVEVFAHDIFPPGVPSGLEAVGSGVGQKLFVDLSWTPDTEADLAGYDVFRLEPGGANWAKINAQLVAAPAFRDENVLPGHIYIYSVSAVDLRGNESARSESASETLP
jgi:hypothetical protein